MLLTLYNVHTLNTVYLHVYMCIHIPQNWSTLKTEVTSNLCDSTVHNCTGIVKFQNVEVWFE